MQSLSLFIIVAVLKQVHVFLNGMDPAYLDLFKIIAGSVAWIGGLTIFMWIKEKNKKSAITPANA